MAQVGLPSLSTSDEPQCWWLPFSRCQCALQLFITPPQMDHVLCFLILNQIACTSVNFFIKILYCLFIKIWSDLHIDLFWLALWLSVKLKKSRSCWCWFVNFNILQCSFMQSVCRQWDCSFAFKWSHVPSSSWELFPAHTGRDECVMSHIPSTAVVYCSSRFPVLVGGSNSE